MFLLQRVKQNTLQLYNIRPKHNTQNQFHLLYYNLLLIVQEHLLFFVDSYTFVLPI